MARLYQEQGYQVALVRDKGGYDNQIISKIADVTGLHRVTVSEYLKEEFKQERKGGIEKGTSVIPASQRVESRSRATKKREEKLYGLKCA